MNKLKLSLYVLFINFNVTRLTSSELKRNVRFLLNRKSKGQDAKYVSLSDTETNNLVFEAVLDGKKLHMKYKLYLSSLFSEVTFCRAWYGKNLTPLAASQMSLNSLADEVFYDSLLQNPQFNEQMFVETFQLLGQDEAFEKFVVKLPEHFLNADVLDSVARSVPKKRYFNIFLSHIKTKFGMEDMPDDWVLQACNVPTPSEVIYAG